MAEYTIGSLCSGYGGLDLAVMDVLDAEPAWHCQYDPDDKHQYAAKILAHHWPTVPNHGDITGIDWAAVDPVDILTAGFPCQDLSLAGKRAGMRDGNRSGLWFHVARAIEALRPSLVVIENVPGILTAEADGDLEPCPWCLGDLGRKRRSLRALGAVLADLARLGFDAEWVSLDAADVGAPHKRRRVFLAAWPAAVQDPDLAARGERRLAAPGQAESRRPRPDARGRGRAPAADADGPIGGQHLQGCRPSTVQGAQITERAPEQSGRLHRGDRGAVAMAALCTAEAPADADGLEPERRGGLAVLGGPAPAEPREGDQRERAGDAVERRGPAFADAHGAGALAQLDREPDRPEAVDEHAQPDAAGRVLDWGAYGPAITRWEHVMMRPAPSPVEPGKTGMRLAPRFVEWLMGCPDGWITAVPGIPRNAQLKAGGNGVVRQQGAEALRRLLAPSLPVEEGPSLPATEKGTTNDQ